MGEQCLLMRPDRDPNAGQVGRERRAISCEGASTTSAPQQGSGYRSPAGPSDRPPPGCCNRWRCSGGSRNVRQAAEAIERRDEVVTMADGGVVVQRDGIGPFAPMIVIIRCGRRPVETDERVHVHEHGRSHSRKAAMRCSCLSTCSISNDIGIAAADPGRHSSRMLRSLAVLKDNLVPLLRQAIRQIAQVRNDASRPVVSEEHDSLRSEASARRYRSRRMRASRAGSALMYVSSWVCNPDA